MGQKSCISFYKTIFLTQTATKEMFKKRQNFNNFSHEELIRLLSTKSNFSKHFIISIVLLYFVSIAVLLFLSKYFIVTGVSIAIFAWIMSVVNKIFVEPSIARILNELDKRKEQGEFN